jgi:endonuclease/exonuclease/phosphatase family metal-dependent hydrolase
MRVATFNTCHGSNGKGTSTDQERLNAACVALDVDLLGLQEVDRGRRRSGTIDQAAIAAAAVAARHAFAPALRPADGEYGNGLLVRGELADVDELVLPQLTPPWRKATEPRSALLASVTVGEHTLSVAVTHLSTSLPEAIRQLVAVARTLRRRPGPHLLMGDLNLRPPFVAAVLRPLGLAPVRDGGPTHPRDNPRMRIDHLAGSGLTITAVEVVDTGCSDHRALVAELVFDDTDDGDVTGHRRDRRDRSLP